MPGSGAFWTDPRRHLRFREAPSALPLPLRVWWAALVGVLLCAGLGKDRKLCSNQVAVDIFIAIRPRAEGAIHVKEFPETPLSQPTALTEGQAMVEGRAVALLNWMSHGACHQQGEKPEKPTASTIPFSTTPCSPSR